MMHHIVQYESEGFTSLQVIHQNKDTLHSKRKLAGGFVSVSRSKFRKINGGRAAVDAGYNRSCMQDAMLACCRALGVRASKQRVYNETLPPTGDTSVGVIMDFAKTLGVNMSWGDPDCAKGRGVFNEKGGPEYALLQRTHGVYFVMLKISIGDKHDSHAMSTPRDS